VAPLAARFVKAYPAVTIEIVVEDGFTDFGAAGFGAGVRFGESLHQDMIAAPLGPAHRSNMM
jgi:DNA-binding transcriptional LysR family regulator